MRSFVGRAAAEIEGGIHHKGKVRGRVQYLSAVEMQLGGGADKLRVRVGWLLQYCLVGESNATRLAASGSRTGPSLNS